VPSLKCLKAAGRPRYSDSLAAKESAGADAAGRPVRRCRTRPSGAGQHTNAIVRTAAPGDAVLAETEALDGGGSAVQMRRQRSPGFG
jgi:hypothetical protein